MADLAAMRQWLQQPGAGRRATRRLANILDALAELRIAPCRWAWSEHDGARQRIVEGYKVIYQVIPDTGDNETAGDVLVVRIFGPRQLSKRL
jgi:hypothetical protein